MSRSVFTTIMRSMSGYSVRSVDDRYDSGSSYVKRPFLAVASRRLHRFRQLLMPLASPSHKYWWSTGITCRVLDATRYYYHFIVFCNAFEIKITRYLRASTSLCAFFYNEINVYSRFKGRRKKGSN